MRALVLSLCLLATAFPAAAQLDELHVPAPAGWTAVDEEYRYGREDLWEYINGAAELFLTYRYRELVVADFERGEDGLTVCVYDMGHPLDAYGIFEVERPTAGESIADVGAAAVLSPPYQGVFIKDRFYVKVEAGGGDVSAEALGAVLRDVAHGLPGSDALPPELAALPEAGRVPGTVAFAGSNFLGLEDLSGCLHAEYRDDAGGEYRLFVMTPSEAFLHNGSGRWEHSIREDGRQLFTREIPYQGVVLLIGDEERLVGVAGVESVERATQLLSERGS